MWDFHAAASPAAICNRADHEGKLYNLWRAWKQQFTPDHWLFGWLYWEQEIPTDVKRSYPSYRVNRKRGPDDGEFFIEQEMLDFRKHSSIIAIARSLGWIGKDKQPSRYAYAWLREYSHLEWFRGWLCRGENAPKAVFVATRAEIKTARYAWHYCGLCKEVSIREETYTEWFRRNVPEERLWDFVFWLYGGPSPSGWYIVAHDRCTPTGICKGLGISPANFWTWLRDSGKRAMLRDALNGKRPTCETGHHSRRRMLDQMQRFAGFVEKRLREAREQAGGNAEQALRDVILSDMESAETDDPNASRHRAPFGVVCPGLFVASQAMVEFSKAARGRGRTRVPQLRDRLPLPLYKEWMLDWTVPRKCYDLEGQREQLIKAAIVTVETDEAPPPADNQTPPPAQQQEEAPGEIPAGDTADQAREQNKEATRSSSAAGGRKRKWDHAVEQFEKRREEDPQLTRPQFLSWYGQHFSCRPKPTPEQLKSAQKYRK